MGAEVGSAWVSILPDAKGFGKKLEGDVHPELSKAGKSGGSLFGGAFKLAAAATAGVAAVSFFKDAIGEARESQKVVAQTEQVIKSTGGVAKVTAGDVDKLATSISNKTGIDDEAIASASNLLLTFTGVRNEVGKGNDVFNQATQIATDMGAALGTDASGSAIQLGKALNDPIKGISALSRVGVSFTEQQKAQIKSLVEHNDTLGAQKIILGELSKEFGGSAEAQATAGEKAAVAFGNLKESVGTALLPALDSLMTFVSGTVLPGLSSLGGFLADTFGPIFNTIKYAVEAFFASMKDGDITSDGLVGAFERVGSFIHDNFRPALAAVSGFITGTLVPAFRAAADFVITNLVPVLTRLAGFFLEHVVPAAQKVAAIVGETLRRGFEILSEKIAENRPQLEAIGTVLLKVAGFIYDQVLPVVAKLAGFLAVTLFKAIGVAIDIIADMVTAITAIKNTTTTVVNWVRDKFTGMVDFFQGIPGKLSGAFHGAFDGLKDAFRSAVNFIIDGWNGLQFTMPSVDTHIPGVGKVGGFTIGVPDIPRLAQGGIVPATPGGRLVTIGEGAHDEAVIPLGPGGFGALIDEVRALRADLRALPRDYQLGQRALGVG